MAEEELNIILRAIDEASKILKGVSNNAEDLEDSLTDVDAADPTISVDDDEIIQATAELEELDQEQISDKVVPVDDDQAEEANAELEALDQEQISEKVVPVDDDQIEAASAGLDGLNSKLLGVAGTIGLVDQATKLWEASTQRQTTQFYLGANLGEKKAKSMQRAIQDIVATVPGDDTFMNTVLSGAMAKQTDLTTQELTKGAQAMADYIAGSEMQGKNAIEAQQDLKSYILSGSTAELQRSSILSNQVDILENKSTVQERINALIEAENAEQVAGLSGYDTAQNKLTEFQGRIEKAQADLGEMFLPAIQGALEFGLALDDSLGGGLMATITGLAAGIPAIVTGLSGVGQAANGVKALTSGYESLKTMLSLTSIQQRILNMVEGEGAIARMASALGITTEAAAAEGATVAFGGLAIAEGAALWPILALIGALAALGVAVYAVGKHFGWWKDVGSMIDSVKAGVQRLWSAFINNPNVQGFLQDLRNAWDGITQALQPVITWAKQVWSNLFPDNATGEVDVVRMIINVFGSLGDFLGKVVNAAKSAWSAIGGFRTVAMVVMGPAMLVVGALRSIICALLGCSPGIVPALRTVQQVFGTVFSSIAGFIPGIVSTIVNVIVSSFGKLPGKVLGFLRKVGNHIVSQGAKWVKNARAKASQVVSGTVAYVKNLPSRVGGYVSSTAHRISSGASGWVTNARNKASAVVTGVTGSISGLPGKVYNEFKAIGSRMLSAGSQLVQNARNIGKNIVSGLLNSMGIHSPGIIQTKVVKEFEDTLALVSGNVGEAQRVGTRFGSALVDGFGEPTLGLDNGLSVYSTGTTKLELHVTHDNNYKFENLPETVSAREVANMINQAAVDDEFTKALTGNPRFQLFDAKQKQRISNRRLRSRGV